MSKNILNGHAAHYGVFYPLQSLKKENPNLPEIPIILDASDAQTLQLLEELAETISDKVTTADDEHRVKLHLAAVFCNNFVNHLYVLMEEYCRKEDLDFSLLIPLIQETAGRLSEIDPSGAQTGPAIRGDSNTIAKHLLLLEGHPHLKELYQFFTRSIQRS